MAPSDKPWPTRRGRRKPLDVLAAQEELAQALRKRFLDAIEAEGSRPLTDVDATKHIGAYSKALDGLIKLQFDLGHLERIAPVRWTTQESVPSGRSWMDYSRVERERMGYEWLTRDMTPLLDSPSKAASDPGGDDA
ncbi:hypothetical protein [Reyranella sp.]|uniref:hypothetical protein n=1 Tax=Reyranella sp. TaxID=1929291 RepID=UPI003784C4E1